uniref:Uncharacterized protein n=1 Tax=Latrodectus hesperus TaxID=256737 RepID=E7D1R7_LATHE|nr:hypothetical protein [Latrodectus hesperus]
MDSLTLFTIGLLATAFLTGSEAQQTFQFSSFSQIPQSVLSALSSQQVENLKQTLSGGGGGGGNGGGVLAVFKHSKLEGEGEELQEDHHKHYSFLALVQYHKGY